ncbi:hypothetical protein HanIR_Chr08g0373581 [Helianthus annuus]|nr:hypothetical protein HanIR_Chr08g0373581 [Helianthus annuus]
MLFDPFFDHWCVKQGVERERGALFTFECKTWSGVELTWQSMVGWGEEVTTPLEWRAPYTLGDDIQRFSF